MSLDFDSLRSDLRGLDGDLYLTHLFAPAAHRDGLLSLYYAYADIARIPDSVSEPMIGAIRLQWWRDLHGGLAEGRAGDSPIGAALLACGLTSQAFLPLIDGREAALDGEAYAAQSARAASADRVGPALMRLSLEVLDVSDAEVIEIATLGGRGFELLRLTAANMPEQAQAAAALLTQAVSAFNRLPRQTRKAALPAFLPIGLAHFQAQHWPAQKSLLAYQWKILKMALRGRL